jgi:UDP-glucuronate decarboxylase
MQLHDGRVISNFIVQALRGEDITIYGDGMQTRSFCFVSDLIEGVIAMMDSPADLIGPVNLGNPTECSISEIAETIIGLCGSQSRLSYRPLPEDDPRQRQPDITLARERLGWQPRIALEDGLRETIDYFRGVLGLS